MQLKRCNFFRKCQVILSGFTIYVPTSSVWVVLYPYPTICYDGTFKISDVLIVVWLYFIMILICVFSLVTHMWNICFYLLICHPFNFFGEVSIRIFAHFFIGMFSYCWILKVLCYGLHVCVPQNSYVETLTPSVIIFGGWDFWEVLGNEGRALMMGLVSS